jgi:hypothetical protein
MLRKLVLVILCLGVTAAAQSKPVVVVELFTSEGCSSCPPADAILSNMQAHGFPGTDLLLMEEHVDYWNHLGWRDVFSSAQFTARQQEYVSRLHLDSAYTPQVVVDGRTELIGSEEAELRRAIAASAQKTKPLKLSVTWGAAKQSAKVQGEGSGAGELYLAFTEDGLSSAVKAGENSGSRLNHAAVVRRLVDVGHVQGAFSKDIHQVPDRSWNTANLHVAAFVQDPASATVLGASIVKVAP